MHISRLIYLLYSVSKAIAKATGMSVYLRKKLSPVIVKLFFNISSQRKSIFTVNGHKMILGSKGIYPPIDMVMNNYESQTTCLFKQLLKPGMVVLDIGSHVGYYTLLAAKQVQSLGQVYSFEPEPTNHDLLLQNIKLNGYQNIQVVNTAVSNQLGHLDLFLTGQFNGTHSIYKRAEDNGTVQVVTTTLDHFLDGISWPKINLIKIDVEGAEEDVLDGMERCIQNSTGLEMIVEYNPSELKNAGKNPFTFFDKLDCLGFNIMQIDEVKGLKSLDKLDNTTLATELLEMGATINLFCSQRERW